jgi:LmbE family N-acetylglucosaminyl deacetylase
VAKLYYMVASHENLAVYQAAFGDLVLYVDGEERRTPAWDDWAITTRIDTSAYWQQVWEAVACHRTQLPGYQMLAQLPEAQHKNLWGTQAYYRVFSLINGGREVEDDLSVGLH